ncbi:MAG: hypothetical protein KBI41_07395 [Kiritimatiellae bacterium]|jgi:hypothetical protein|nr:hypothetical protein [Kiritimatiellia bacterium]MDD2348338.1 hypothetical protein [Kiritimatiellia bacterium]MDD3584591.1 hypothetical protein [Kiritimatiellia bacterium]HHU14755.1 hypothetical protein [Lentisphaerota bacterium]
MKRKVLFTATTALVLIAGGADLPWKFEGDTTRSPVSAGAGVVATAFVGGLVSAGTTVTTDALEARVFTEKESNVPQVFSREKPQGLILFLR